MSYKIKCTLISSYYILSLFLRKKLSIDWMKTEEIYQLSLNIDNKAWLNTYLAKTLILITVEFQELLEIFTGIFYLHLHSYSSLAKTWLLYETGFLSGLSFPHPTLSMVECSFGFLSSVSRGILQFEAKRWYTDKNLELGWLREQATPAGHASSLSVTKPPGFAPTGHLHHDIILPLRPESSRVLLSCVN